MKHQVLLALAFGVLTSSAAPVTDAAFFRLSSPSNQVSLSLSSTGILTWSNFPAATYFQVERSTALLQTNWAPWARGTSVVAGAVSLKVTDFSPPTNMVYIPAGYYTEGDILGDLPGIATPVHPAYVSGFFIERYEVTNDAAVRVFQWALDHGKIAVTTTNVVNTEGTSQPLLQLNKWNSEISVSNNQFVIESGRGSHPFVYVTWYGAVAYCEYMNQMNGLPSCYEFTNWTCDFNSSGYRLPTETEWEKAARGGWEGLRFPWSDTLTIAHSQANYDSSTNNAYDISPTRGYNPLASWPLYSLPVGTFAPNNYGLYDMAGNAWEWCWDWAGKYTSTTQFDPTGPTTGTYRVFRGGSWRTTAERVTCAMRYLSFYPTNAYDDIGLRVVRRIPQ